MTSSRDKIMVSKIKYTPILLFFLLFLPPVSFAKGRLYITRVIPMGERLLHDQRCDDINPCWSPDGSLIAFERIGKGVGDRQGIYYFDLRDYLPRPITEVEGKKFTFGRDRGLSTTKDEDFYASYFNWAPDESQRFVYTEGLDLYIGKIKIDKVSHPGVYRKEYSVDKQVFLKIKEESGEFVSNKYADWSIHESIVFVSGKTGNGDLYMLNVRDANTPNKLKRLTHNSQLDTTPKWSPDGIDIVYSALEDGSMNIRLIKNIGVGSRTTEGISLTHWQTEEVNPAWSPDGKMIAFYVLTKGKVETYDLWVMDNSGANREKVASNVLRQEKGGPSWLPEGFGRKLIYILEHGNEMYVLDVDSKDKWIVETGNRVMSDVSCPRLKDDPLLIAYSAQDANGRKRIYIRSLKLTKEKYIKGSFVVSIGPYEHKENAVKIMNLLRGRGYLESYKDSIYISKPVKVKRKNLYRVLIGPFDNKATADAITKRINLNEEFKAEGSEMLVDDAEEIQ